jgi:hypothetical protein
LKTHLTDGNIETGLSVCVNVWLWAISSLWGWVIFGSGRIASWTPYAVAFGIVNICVSVAATKWLGIVGPLLGTATAFLLVDSWGMPTVIRQIFGVRRADLYRSVLRPFAWGAPYAYSVYLAVAIVDPTSWLAIATAAAASVTVGGLLWWFVGLKHADRQLWVAQTRTALSPVF